MQTWTKLTGLLLAAATDRLRRHHMVAALMVFGVSAFADMSELPLDDVITPAAVPAFAVC
jgi:hypothetical protein